MSREDEMAGVIRSAIHDDLAELIRAAKEAAYDEALADQRENALIPTRWVCAHPTRRVHTAYCWAKPVRPHKLNPYRKVG